MKDEYIYITLTIIIVALVFWIMPMVRTWWAAPLIEQEPEWCLVEELPASGGSWSQQQPGEHEYQVIQTQSGFKVFQRCDMMK